MTTDVGGAIRFQPGSAKNRNFGWQSERSLSLQHLPALSFNVLSHLDHFLNLFVCFFLLCLETDDMHVLDPDLCEQPCDSEADCIVL